MRRVCSCAPHVTGERTTYSDGQKCLKRPVKPEMAIRANSNRFETDIGNSGYPLKRSTPGQAALHGRFAGELSRLGGCPVPPVVFGGFLAGVEETMRSW